jgi:hypothetical protein
VRTERVIKASLAGSLQPVAAQLLIAPKGKRGMPKTWPEMTVEEKLEELHRGRQSVIVGLARIIEEMCTIVKRLDEEFAEFRQKQNPPTNPGQ